MFGNVLCLIKIPYGRVLVFIFYFYSSSGLLFFVHRYTWYRPYVNERVGGVIAIHIRAVGHVWAYIYHLAKWIAVAGALRE